MREPYQSTPLARRSKALVQLVADQVSGASDVVHAALIEDASADVSSNLIDSLLEAHLRDNRLVPATRIGAIEGVGAAAEVRRLERAKVLDEMRANALAEGTLRNYGGHLRAWRDWCNREGVPALPFEPEHVADFLIDYVLDWDSEAGDYLREEDGALLASVAVGTVENRLHALNKAAEFMGLPKPGANPGVQEVMSGLRRKFGTATKGKAALDMKLLTKCLAAAEGTTHVVARDRVLTLLRARTNATAGQLAKLMWSDVCIAADASEVSVQLPKAHRHGQSTAVRVEAHPNPDLCLVVALKKLQVVAHQLREVISTPSGRPLTRQAVHASLVEVWEALPHMTAPQLARFMADRGIAHPPFMTRDRALLLVGFYTALRRSNLSGLNWGDVTDHGEDGWSLAIRFSKTDQEGKGSTSWVPEAGSADPGTCPSTALRCWKECLEESLGRPVRPNEPVFVSFTRTGKVKTKGGRLTRLSGGDIHAVVQRLTVAAGLARNVGAGNPYGAHSLRAGFVTEATRDGKLSDLEVMEVTGHKTSAMVARYRREVNAPKANAARKLMGILNGQ